MKKKYNFLVYILVFVLLLANFSSLTTFAAAPNKFNYSEITIHTGKNGKLISENKGVLSYSYSPDLLDDNEYVGFDEVAREVRKNMVNRIEAFTVFYYCENFEGTSESAHKIINDVLEKALEHTGKAMEGDYLRFCYDNVNTKLGGNWINQDEHTANLRIEFNFTYYTNSAQEQAVGEKIDDILSEIIRDQYSDYAKIKNIYQYIVSNVAYDQEHKNDEDYKIKFTAYAALFDHKAVCQGYGMLLYRMLLTTGIDARFISSAQLNHGWNICKLNNKYYYLDATLDRGAEFDEWKYFLRGTTDFYGHNNGDDNFSNIEFMNAYPRAEGRYKEEDHLEPSVPEDPIEIDDTINLADARVLLPAVSYVYDGNAKKPEVRVILDETTLVKDQDYEVTYTNNTNAGTATVKVEGIGTYVGEITSHFDIKKAKVTLNAAPDVTLSYQESQQVVSVVATGCPGYANVKYTSDNSKITVAQDGKATVAAGYAGKAVITATVASTANYTGFKVATTIIVKKLQNTLAAKDITKVYKTKNQTVNINATYNGEKPTYSSTSKKVTVDSNGKVTIAKKFIGSAIITVKSEGNYKAEPKTITVKVTVNPTGTSISSVKNTAKKAMVVKWKKKSWTGYQIAYAKTKDFTDAKNVNIKKKSTLSKKIGKLTKGKKYYVKVRTYKTVNKVKYYSKWSSVKSIKIKK